MRYIKLKPPVNTLMCLCYGLLGIYAYVNSNRVINNIFVLISIIVLIDGLYFELVYRKIKIQLELEDRAQKNEQFKLKVRVNNEGILPSSYIELVPKSTMRTSLIEQNHIGLMLLGKEQVEHTILYRADLCGLEEIGLDKIIYKSFFSFFKKEIVSREISKIKLVPEIRALGNMTYLDEFLQSLKIPEKKQVGMEKVTIFGDEIGYELKPYMEGDSQRLIHWKMAAYKDELLVRQRQQSSGERKHIFLVLTPFLLESEKREFAVKQDKLLTVLISLVYYYLEQGQQVEVAYYKNRSWKYIEIRENIQLKSLQADLGDYSCLPVEQTMNQRSIIKNFLKTAHQKEGIKVLISNYWSQEMEEYILRDQQNHLIPCIWTGSHMPPIVVQQSNLSLWHINDQYDMTFLGSGH